MGFRNLRDLFRLPRAELARRIGPDALDHLDRMRGFAAETLARYRPADRFERKLEFAFGIESQGALAFALQRLVRELATFLVARDGGVARFTLVLGHERGATTRIDVGLLAPQREAASLLDLARARLERIELVAPVHALTLCAEDLPPLCPLHRDLFDERRAQTLDWPTLIERLRARLGDMALQGLGCVADHRPARAWQFTNVEAEAASRTRPNAVRTNGAGFCRRPFWLLRRPMPLRDASVRILAGPERIECGWWDEHDKRRDYYVIETHLGQRAWAFVPVAANAGWTLHGWFA
jgi:protein ImuB